VLVSWQQCLSETPPLLLKENAMPLNLFSCLSSCCLPSQQAALNSPQEQQPQDVDTPAATERPAPDLQRAAKRSSPSSSNVARMIAQRQSDAAHSDNAVPQIHLPIETVDVIKEITADLKKTVVELRRDIHRNPELSNQEQRTAGIVATQLEAAGFNVRRNVGGSGVVGQLVVGKGGKRGKVVGLRADMDALPVNEATGLEFASEVKGVMHACGHDGHTAMLLGAAKVFAELRDRSLLPDCEIRLIFQPAEELGTGAAAMIRDGAINGVDIIFGQHIDPRLPSGAIAMRSGPLLASAKGIRVSLSNTGEAQLASHNSFLATAQLVQEFNEFSSPVHDPNKRDVVATPTRLGDSKRPINVSPPAATVHATIHSSLEQSANVEDDIRAMAQEVARERQQDFDITFSLPEPDSTVGSLEADTATRQVKIAFAGRPAHSGMPEKGRNPILSAAKMATDLHAIYNVQSDKRREGVKVELTALNDDSAEENTSLPVAQFGASLRTFGDNLRNRILDDFEDKAKQTAIGLQQQLNIETLPEGSYDTTENPYVETVAAENALRAAGMNVIEADRVTASEDFAKYQQDVVGVFSLLGAAPEGMNPQDVAGHHTPKFVFNEDAMEQGVQSLVLQSMNFLHPRLKSSATH
jgi:hippurate hydrolase